MRKIITIILIVLLSLYFTSCSQPKFKQTPDAEMNQTSEQDKKESKSPVIENPVKQNDIIEERKIEEPYLINPSKSFLNESNPNLPSDKVYYSSKAVVLTYHHFSHKPASGITITPERFEADLKMLKDNHFNVISLKDMINTMQGSGKMPQNAVVITIDDGYESNFKMAYPILKKYNLPATIFLVTSWPENYKPSDFEFNPMSPEQVREMYKSGLIDIQSHSYKGHDYITRNEKGDLGGMLAFRIYDKKTGTYEPENVYEDRVVKDLETSIAHIEKYTTVKPDTFCFPFGHYNTKLVELGKKAGLKYFVTTAYGYNNENSKSSIIRRIRSGDTKLTPEKLKENIIICGQGRPATQ